MISKILQILGLQPRISKKNSQPLEQFFLKVDQDNFGNKIPLFISFRMGPKFKIPSDFLLPLTSVCVTVCLFLIKCKNLGF